jgi:O-acetyl-ADP-ribose deacetylase (regulator of RNase III)
MPLRWRRTSQGRDVMEVPHAVQSRSALVGGGWLVRRPRDTVAMQIEARLVDITTLAVDAIVNAANTDLAPGGGVCGAIHRAAGPELAVACARLRPCPTGQARLTPGFRLSARFVIHAVGPVWHGGNAGEATLLASAYRASLVIAREEALESVAFPAISTGIYGYPVSAATAVAVAAVRAELVEPGSLTHVVFACFDRETLEAYAAEGVAV